MRRVYAIWLWRQMTTPVALRAYALGGITIAAVRYVSFGDVILNAPRIARIADMEPFFTFAASAFLNTEIMTQILALLFVALAGWILRDSVLLRYSAMESRRAV